MGAPSKFTRNEFENLLTSHKATLTEILERKGKGVEIHEDYLFTLESVIAICHKVALGAARNVRKRRDPKTEWAKEADWKDFADIFKKAFTTS